MTEICGCLSLSYKVVEPENRGPPGSSAREAGPARARVAVASGAQVVTQ